MFQKQKKNKEQEENLTALMEQAVNEARQTRQEEKDKLYKDEKEITPKERFLNALKSTKKDKEEESDVKIDLTKAEDEVLVEKPLPFSMATEFIPIKSITNGIIETTYGTYLKIVEVMPTNFLLKGQSEKENIVYSFMNFIELAGDNYQFKMLQKSTDVSQYLKILKEEMENEKNPECKLMQKDFEGLIRKIGKNGSVSTRFFIIFKYKNVGLQKASFEEVEHRLSYMEQNAISYLSKSMNSVVIQKKPTDDTARMLYDIFNIDGNSKTEFLDRINEVDSFYLSKYGEKSLEMIPITEYFGARLLDFSHANYMRMDNHYIDFLFISGNGYPTETNLAWLTNIMRMSNAPLCIDMVVSKQPRIKMIETIGRKLRFQNPRLREMSDTSSEADALQDAIWSGYYMKEQMSRNKQDLYYINIMLTIEAESPKELMEKVSNLKDELKTEEFAVYGTDMLHEKAFQTYMPLCEVDKIFYERTKQNILTLGLAGSYPFASFEMFENNGVMLGRNMSNSSYVSVDFFDSSKRPNSNVSIIGKTGGGKTFALSLLASRLRRKGIQTFIISPEKGDEFKRIADALGGEYIVLSPSGTQCINVMEIRKKDTESSELLYGEETTQSALIDKIESLHTLFSLLIPDISDVEDQLLDEALMRVYANYGITKDNDSLFADESMTTYKKMPILEDVYDELLKSEATHRIATIMNLMVHGSASVFNQQTNVNLDNLFVCIDLSKINENSKLLPIAMYIALDYVYSKAKEDKTKKKSIFIDEAWKLMGSAGTPLTAGYILNMFKIIRGYGGQAVCATQDINDFFALDNGKYGKGILNASSSKIVLGLEDDDADKVAEVLRLSPNERASISSFERGQALLMTNKTNIPIYFTGTELETELITTDRNQLKEQVERKKKELKEM